jgi:hypothetical protein
MLQLSPQELLALYKTVLLSNDVVPHQDLVAKIENIMLSSLEDSWQKAVTTGFDKWLKSETNKIKDLEDEIKKINESIPREELIKKFVPASSSRNKQKGRPRKKQMIQGPK